MANLINRQDAIEAICDEIMSRFDVGVTEGYELVEDALSSLPSVEPEPILDKIRSEIEEVYINLTYEENHSCGASWGLRNALEIIDKYKSKSDIEELSSEESEIISCKDCKHRGEEPIADGRYWCDIHDTFMYYCSDAEKRIGG